MIERKARNVVTPVYQLNSERREHGIGCFFFFQAEDGIRDYKVTGVQTCALPISQCDLRKLLLPRPHQRASRPLPPCAEPSAQPDRKSTRLNSSHLVISYAVFCLKKKKHILDHHPPSLQSI